MSKPTVRIEGLNTLERKLFQVAGALQNPVLAQAVDEGAEIVRKDAAERAPRGPTGKLQDEMLKVPMKGTPERAATRVGPSADAFYGEFQEKGTKYHAAQPFLRPALDSNARAVVSSVRRHLARALLSRIRPG